MSITITIVTFLERHRQGAPAASSLREIVTPLPQGHSMDASREVVRLAEAGAFSPARPWVGRPHGPTSESLEQLPPPPPHESTPETPDTPFSETAGRRAAMAEVKARLLLAKRGPFRSVALVALSEVRPPTPRKRYSKSDSRFWRS
eukprot:CAMPEP_0182816728 /NCGR_PEP_ID=MMETSP0006_2-20121128/11092_1 /TAXON_ID=97485 /ORGANISM="Prymnesium parvum, Strain Texoma1" /LENGTH=145 /DNA_ID=CAMNT_0024943039 /DNA_START=301 /DNA_END=738 /DNA_ORIENTATION=-